MTLDIVAVFCDVDEFCLYWIPFWQQHVLANRPAGKRRRRRKAAMHLSEIMTLLILFHCSNYRSFKHFYLDHVAVHRRGEFPRLSSYSRFVERIPEALAALAGYLHTRFGACTGISVIDSTPLAVCDNLRISRHRTFAGLAQRGKTSTGWFFGFKLHLLINHQGQLLNIRFTPGNVDDRAVVQGMTRRLYGKLVADKGYLSQELFEQLFARGVHLLTGIKRNMKNRLMPLADKLLLYKRSVIETILDRLKNEQQIEHSRHRSPINYFADIIAGLIAYTHDPDHPRMDLTPEELAHMQSTAA